MKAAKLNKGMRKECAHSLIFLISARPQAYSHARERI